MTTHVNIPSRVTRAAEGLGRIRWTLADLDRMVEVGLIGESERVELIGGEIVPMSPKGIRHEHIKSAVLRMLYRHLPTTADVTVELGWRPAEHMYFEPDIVVYPADKPAPTVAASEALLIIEVAKSSLPFDTNLKAKAYAALGVRDYWVINADTLATTVFRGPSESGYTNVVTATPDEPLEPIWLPGLVVRLADIDGGSSA